MSLHPSIRRAVLCLIGALLILTALTACEKTAPISPNPPAAQPAQNPSTAPAASADPGEAEPADDAQTVPAIKGGVDADADTVEGIPIKNASELSRIGTSAKFPMDGDYVLVADLDLSSLTSFAPIGGSESESGIVSGSNVFTGTFDGRGHTISGLRLAVSSSKRVHVGLFGSVGSADSEHPAVIKNLILKDVSVRGNAAGVACYAALCGQCSGYVTIDNIALLSGSVEVTNKSGDLLGVAALVGQCRTDTNTGMTNKPIKITNIFSNISVTADNRGNNPYTSGIIGRIRGGDIGQLKNVVQLGTVTHEGTVGGGNAISIGDAGVKVKENIYYLAGCGVDYMEFGQAKSYESLSGGNLTLDPDVWHTAEGLYPMPEILYNSPYFAVVDFVALSLAEGDTPDRVENDFPLTTVIMGKNITWNSDKPSVILIDQGTARVTKPEFGYETVKLTARADGVIKTYELRVFSGVYGKIERVGDNLYARNYPAGVTYKWIVKDVKSGKTVNTDSTKNDFVALGANDTNRMVTLQVEGYDDVYYFVSNLPTIFINSSTGYYDVSKGGYSTATMRIAATEKFPDTAYDGGISIKVRGNSTAWAPKRPFKIKLDTKADLFGMGANKHWCLLANYYDRTNLRNKVSYDFSMDLGLVGCESELANLIYKGEYVGLYEFTEAIRIGETRVDIFDWEEEAESVAKAISKKEGLTKDERTKLEDNLTRDLSWITTGVYGDYTISEYYDTSGYDITGGYLIEDDAYYNITKSGYSSAAMTVTTTEKFPDTSYDGGVQIKLRGNSTAWGPKRPFK
ncbi:MAG: CotH kinase family protein, partial [Clostridia bacterium]|nr:CotH kinase family protein [Clostridia bacterium]